MLQYSPEKLFKLFNLCVPQKVFGVYIFPYFVLVQHIVVQNSVKTRSSYRRCSVKKGVRRNFIKFTGKHLCQSLYLIKLQDWSATLSKQTLAKQVFSCKFSKISKNIFFTEYVWATASIKHTQNRYILLVFFYFQVTCNCSNSLKQKVKHSYYNL